MGFSVIPEPAISGFTGPQGPAGTIPSDPVFSGSAGVNDTTGDPNIDIKKNGSLRWKIRSAGTESGSNNGSDLYVETFDDAGAKLNDALWISRTSGQVVVGQADSAQGGVKLSVNGAIGTRDLAADPATTGLGVQIYSKAGKLWVQTANGAEKFQIQPPSASGAVSSVNGQTGAVTLAAADVGAIPTSDEGLANGVATLDANGKLPASQITSSPTFSDFVIINASAAGNYGTVALRKLNKKRWAFAVTGATETGTNDTGSNFLIQSYTDAEIEKTYHFFADRASGSTTIGSVNVMNGARLAVDGGAIGIVNQAADPTTSSLGSHIYSKSGRPWVQRSSGATPGGAINWEIKPRPSEFLPEDLGLLAWTSDPSDCISTGAYTGITNARVSAVYLREPQSVSKIVWHFTGYAGGLLAGSWAAVYNSSGTRMAYNDSIHTGTNEPAEQHGLGGGTSYVPVTATTLPAGLYFIVWRFNYTTSPADGPMCLQYENSAGAPPNVFGLTPVKRFGVLDATSQTTSFTSLTVANITSGANRFWAALA